MYPFDDLHRFHRPAALIAASGAKNLATAFQAALETLTTVPSKKVRTLRAPRIIKGPPK